MASRRRIRKIPEVHQDRFGVVWSDQPDNTIQAAREQVMYLRWADLEALRGPLVRLVPET